MKECQSDKTERKRSKCKDGGHLKPQKIKRQKEDKREENQLKEPTKLMKKAGGKEQRQRKKDVIKKSG
jgi:hypothetical protein